jgi:hypothetical protein
MSASHVFNSAPDLAHDPRLVAATDLVDILLLIAATRQEAAEVVKPVSKNDVEPRPTALAGFNLVFFIGSDLDHCVATRDNQFDDGAAVRSIVRDFLHFSVFL